MSKFLALETSQDESVPHQSRYRSCSFMSGSADLLRLSAYCVAPVRMVALMTDLLHDLLLESTFKSP